jgi:ketosteroid isomerase-like protein
MSLEDRVRRLEDREAIEELKYRYGYCIDRRRWEAFADLFTEDCRLEYSREGLDDFEGRDSLDEYVAAVESQREFMAHMFHNPVIDVDSGGDRATGQWYFEAAMTDTEGVARWAQGRYDDVYRRVDGEWKIHRVATTYHYSTTYEGGWTGEVLEA